LIELIIVVAILTITASLAMPSYRAWIQNTQLRTAAESIQNGLQKARTEALKRNANTVFTLGANATWTVGCATTVGDLDGDGLADCPAVIERRSSGDGSSTNITITEVPTGATQAVFTSLGMKSTTVANQLTEVTVDLSTLTATESRELKVTISNGGEVRTCDPNAGASDPRKC
jgi:type IV fimbrial biogenesis protein FimT